MFEVGDDICYIKSKEETFPGRVLEIKKCIKISYRHINGTKIRWVHPDSIALQDSSRCSHNSECGLCDDTGKCFYQ